MRTLFYIALFIVLLPVLGWSQGQPQLPAANYQSPEEFEIGGIRVEGTEFLDEKVLVSLTGLRIGQQVTIPGDDITRAIRKLWDQRLFTDVAIRIDKKLGSTVFLIIEVQERPRLSRYSLVGIKKGEADDIRKKLNLRAGSIFTEADALRIERTVKFFYYEKGFYNVDVTIFKKPDSILQNAMLVEVFIDKGKKVKIDQLDFIGNKSFKDRKLGKQMKETRERVKFELAELLQVRKNRLDTTDRSFFYQLGDASLTKAFLYGDDFVNLNIFKTSKFNKKQYEADKEKLIDFYRDRGYRDAVINFDTVMFNDEGFAEIFILLKEGNQYYFRDVIWSGNTKYSDSVLSRMLQIEPGTPYSQSVLDEKLFMSESGTDVSSLYMDDGYLFFNVTPIEKRIDGDSVDIELKVYEGPQAKINEVRILGNTKTSEKVIRRELRTLPGNKFSRTDLIRSQREIINLGYFDPQQLEVIPLPNPENGTVDIEYRVVEKPSDQLELSMGWGGRGNGVVGTLGVQFTNFSLQNMFTKGAWTPLPSGDGQNLTARIQSNGRVFQSYNVSFTEPWLGGKKPNSFTLSFFRQKLNSLVNRGFDRRTRPEVDGTFTTTGASVSIGTRLKWPDDFFVIRSSLNYQLYNLDNYVLRDFFFSDGTATNINLETTLSRVSIDQPLYPTRGSEISLTVGLTLPYSRMFKGRRNLDYNDPNLSDRERFKWVEYHKWRFDAEWYTSIVGNLVLKTGAKFGFLGTFNKDLGITPFERYELGGEGFNQVLFLGRDIIGLRGYDVITDDLGAPIFNKYTMELRYPLSLNQSATVYALAFFEAGNFWNDASEYRPFDLRRSVGAGVRVFLPMFGLLGFDYGIGFDKDIPNDAIDGNIFQKYGEFRIILGFEPE